MNVCLSCYKELRSQTNRFCSNACQKEYEYQTYISRWLKGIESGTGSSGTISKHVRKFLLAKYRGSCSSCGWNTPHPDSGVSPLEIHHLDGNAFNSVPENITLLCPNCHALTPNYKARNKVSARTKRKASS